MAYVGIGEITIPTTGFTWFGLNFLFDTSIHLALALGTFVTTQCALVIIHGPSIALKGSDYNAVIVVAEHMRAQRKFIMKLGAYTLVCLFLTLLFNFWAKVSLPVCISSTVLFTAGFILCVYEGLRCYKKFHPDRKHSVTTSLSDKLQSALSPDYLHTPTSSSAPTKGHTSDERSRSPVDVEVEMEEVTLLKKEAMSKARGRLWWREPIDDGGELVECYAVIDRGRLDIYSSEEDYKKGNNALTDKPYKLFQYRLVQDYRYFPKHMSTGIMAARSLFTGQSEISLFDLATSDYDLKEAVKKYRFVLAPRVFSELSPLPTGEFMAGDGNDYKHWTAVIKIITRAYEKLEVYESAEESPMKRGQYDVESIVQAANK
eukprot:CAMPEP_0185031762 /NCGR_PEP_ID=MMETSP1103-20130426/19397_1 /TAXON_ID=36769 /ORGANISM="Paraphysomonas bandaiensis, Strain Caron Lab Isolate" /LENGTH=373 /DNA_ID=CAMNT_0027567399 /DNA_START=195 /DNA_END=1316 /DNA_ORIENTATION=-